MVTAVSSYTVLFINCIITLPFFSCVTPLAAALKEGSLLLPEMPRLCERTF